MKYGSCMLPLGVVEASSLGFREWTPQTVETGVTIITEIAAAATDTFIVFAVGQTLF